MVLEEINPVLEDNLPIEDFRNHLLLGTGFGEVSLQDKVIAGFLRAALSAIEARISRAILARPFKLTVNCWSKSDAQVFPLAPVTSVTLVELRDANDVATLVGSEVWRLKADAAVPQLEAKGAALPQIASKGTAQISFIAGYTSWEDVPADMKQAVMLLASHYYENRNETHLSQGCMPFGVTALIERYRNLRVGFGGAQ